MVVDDEEPAPGVARTHPMEMTAARIRQRDGLSASSSGIGEEETESWEHGHACRLGVWVCGWS